MNPYNISITIITHNNNNSKYIQVSKFSAAPRIPTFQHSILAHIPVRIPDISPFHSRASDHSQYTAHTTAAGKPAAPITTSLHSGQHVRNSSLMVALGVGDARTLRPQLYAYASAKWRTSYEKLLRPCVSFLPVLISFYSFLPVHIFPQVFPFHRVITINHDLHLRLIQTLCLHLSHSTLPRKTLTSITTSASIVFNSSCWKYGFKVTEVYPAGNSGTRIIGTVHRYLS